MSTVLTEEVADKIVKYIAEQELSGVINEDQSRFLCDCFEQPENVMFKNFFNGIDFTNATDETIKRNIDTMIDRLILMCLKQRASDRDPNLSETYKWLLNFKV